jgi:hypothetical protein
MLRQKTGAIEIVKCTWMVKYKLFAEFDLALSLSESSPLASLSFCGKVGTPENHEFIVIFISLSRHKQEMGEEKEEKLSECDGLAF